MKQEKKVWYAPNKFESYGEQEIQAVVDCLRSGWLAGFGPKSIEFEEKIAKYFGKKYGVFVNSGSSACLLALASLLLPKGTKVITPAYYRDWETDRKSTRLNSSHSRASRMPSSA